MYIDHIAIAVDDIDKAIRLFSQMLSIEFSKPREIESQKTMVAFAELENCKLELIEASSESSPLFPILPHRVLRFVQEHGWGLHHIAFGTDDINMKIAELNAKGFSTIESQPSKGAEGEVTFVSPESTKGVLVEFCEKKI